MARSAAGSAQAELAVLVREEPPTLAELSALRPVAAPMS
jgi:hypothetical protein